MQFRTADLLNPKFADGHLIFVDGEFRFKRGGLVRSLEYEFKETRSEPLDPVSVRLFLALHTGANDDPQAVRKILGLCHSEEEKVRISDMLHGRNSQEIDERLRQVYDHLMGIAER